MMRFIRNNAVFVLVVVIFIVAVFIGTIFLVWGRGSMSSSSGERSVAAWVGEAEVPYAEFVKTYDSAASRSLCSRSSSLIPTYMSAVPRMAKPGMPCSAAICSPLVDTHGIVETTLHDQDIRQNDPASDSVRDVPGLLEMSHTLGIRPIRGLEVPGCPGGKTQESGCPSPPEMVILRDEIENPLRKCHGPRHIAPGQASAAR